MFHKAMNHFMFIMFMYVYQSNEPHVIREVLQIFFREVRRGDLLLLQ